MPHAAPPRCLLLHTDVPHRPTTAELAALEAACPGLRVLRAADGLGAVETAAADVLVTDQRIPLRLDDWPRLRWIQLLSAGANQITGTPVATADVLVTTASGLHGVPIGQFVTGGLLMLTHQFPALAAAQATRRWPPDRWALRGALLRGATAGILGYGSIGRECGRQLHALGMRVLALDPGARRDTGYSAWPGTGDPNGDLPEAWFGPEQLHEMLSRCDVLVVAAPYTARTAGCIGARELSLLKKGARVLIISRGGIVQEKALAEALRQGHLAGALVDCFEQEPLPPEHFFHDTPNLVLTPHIAGAFEGFWSAFMALLTENLARFVRGEKMHNIADKALGY
jgi:phosphoglycerate dehydrogenase-like enzyme